MEFHVSRQSRDRYEFDQSLYALSGNVIFANFQGARIFAQKMNAKRDLVNHPERAVRAGEINAMGLIDEILHVVVKLYRKQRNPQAIRLALEWLNQHVGQAEVENALVQFANEFPPLAVYRGEMSLPEYFLGSTEGVPNQQILLEEMLMLWIANKNPAFGSFEDLFSDAHLNSDSVYPQIMAELYRFFDTQPPFGPDNQNLVDVLRAPAINFPHSLFAQLDYIRDRWVDLLGEYFSVLLKRMLASLDLIREEETQRGGFTGPGPVPVPVYDAAAQAEVENFSPDRDWMPRLVLLAKNTYVWLDQLSLEYGRRISRLDEIPDEELQRLARGGFTGLWLIGLWERSRASARVKQLMGNPEALASAYSLFDYRIADDLGGEAAYNGLRDKAARFGIRLASDMVPNHMGIDSPWVAEHPDWFLSLDYSPFPAYSFSGVDLSEDWRASVYLEDHYFTRTDAAVVFKDIDRRDGRERYIYHGNDGTTMPWNDTAQLNYLMPQVREAVIQTILAVARRFPIIRFDAAMTLAKLHYQRLWFPTPGTGGAIPSRAEFGMTKEQFDALMPVEFWREVVDRVAQEAPDTLLLAEAFWLMESYFVRTLGMHRVYNSAFMNLLRNEENAKYRTIMKNTLEFEPEILKRYVNFMNNPDERTAVDQFGKGDKYFGICTVMATFPGLPMFGHGQVEGYSEKYGMEFKRAYWNEQPDPDLVARHEREIFPLLHRRALFAGVENFLLYDFFTPEGGVNEDVYAYSNRLGDDRALIVFHNKFAETSGWVRTSAGFSVKGSDGERAIVQRTLGEALGLRADPSFYLLFRDQASGLEYIRPSREILEKGMFLSLHAYQYHAFMDIREVQDDEWGSYRRVNEYLAGKGTPSVQNALQELLLQPVLQPLREIFNAGYFNYLIQARLRDPKAVLPPSLLREAREKLTRLIAGVDALVPLPPPAAEPEDGEPLEASARPPAPTRAEVREDLLRDLTAGLRLALSLPTLPDRYPLPGSVKYQQAAKFLAGSPEMDRASSMVLLVAWLFTRRLGWLVDAEHPEATAVAWVDEWLFGRVLADAARDLGIPEDQASGLSASLKLFIEHQHWFEKLGKKSPGRILEAWLSDADVLRYLNIHRFEDVLWFNKERFESLIWWMVVLAMADAVTGPRASASLMVERLLVVYNIVQKILAAEDKSQYQVARLLQALA